VGVQALSDIGAKLTGYPAISIFHEFKYHPKQIITGTQDWVYEHLGALFWTVEIWAPNKEAGITDYQVDRVVPRPPAGRRPEAAEVERRTVRRPGARGLVPFRHPQLGMVELGGWDKMNFWRNPPPHLREREAARFPAWLMQIWAVAAAAGGAARRGACAGQRHLARALCGRQQRLPAGLRVQARAGTQDGARHDLPHPPARGHVPGQRQGTGRRRPPGRPCAQDFLQAFLPSRDITGDRAVVEWVVHGPRGTPIALSARADRAGNVRTEVTLD
jgi:hypothetical protein